MRLTWSPAAIDDLDELIDYVKNDLGSPRASKRLFDAILYKAELFAATPGAGTILRSIRGTATGYRYMLCGNWMIFFSCTSEEALVVRILYARSNYMKVLFGKQFESDE
ncbi:MAG: type II toxin-antitoxin system RelE/ParE family toxin [Atopobiaceae bacterium]